MMKMMKYPINISAGKYILMTDTEQRREKNAHKSENTQFYIDIGNHFFVLFRVEYFCDRKYGTHR